MSAGTATERMMREYDVCHCGDYRLQHDDRGCRVCRSNYAPWDRCDGFMLHLTATEVPRFYRKAAT